MSKKWFCFDEEGLEPLIKTGAFMAAYLIAKNNKELAKSAMPVALAIQKQVDAGGDNDALNALLKQTIVELSGKFTDKDPVIKQAIETLLSSLKINVPAGTFPVLTNKKIDELVDSFVNGMQAGIV